MGYYRETQLTYLGKRAAHYVNAGKLALSEAGKYEIFYGNDKIIVLTPDNCLCIYGASGLLATIDGLSKRAIQTMQRLDAVAWAKMNSR